MFKDAICLCLMELWMEQIRISPIQGILFNFVLSLVLQEFSPLWRKGNFRKCFLKQTCKCCIVFSSLRPLRDSQFSAMQVCVYQLSHSIYVPFSPLSYRGWEIFFLTPLPQQHLFLQEIQSMVSFLGHI